MSIVHGDLKSGNILVTPSGRACIMDFGMSNIDDSRVLVLTSSSVHGGTTRYTAPELFDGGHNSQVADIYAFACVCFEIFTGTHIFSGLNDAAIIYKVKGGLRPARPQSKELTNNMWDLMQNCWDEKPSIRAKTKAAAQLIRSSYHDLREAPRDWDEAFPKRLRSSLRDSFNITHEELDAILP